MRSIAATTVPFLLILACQMSVSPGLTAAEPASPEQFLKRPVGTDFQLADWKAVSGYYEQLARESPRVELKKVGLTTEGRDFLIAVISSDENLARIEDIKAAARLIADPRGKSPEERKRAIESGRVIVFVTPTMHSTEVAATEMAMQLAWTLATSNDDPWKSIRDNAVVVITPSLNPDGVDHVVSWYRENAYTPFEGSGMTKLYQFYTGHDNNRDWFMLSQLESQHLTRLLYHEWFPQILWDVHQQGNSRERYFVPPYRDPLNPNIDPGIVTGTNLIGTRASMDLVREGLTGVATGVSYDNWWNGGNRSVPCRHNIIGILTEAASARLASPIYQEQSALKAPVEGAPYVPSNTFVAPWPGGWWRVGDIIRYELAFAKSLCGTINREPKFWLTNAMDAADRVVAAGKAGGPRAWLIPSDNPDLGATRRLLTSLRLGGVEVQVATAPFKADERDYPAGTVVIWRDQPYGNYVKDLFERQEFPAGTKPYDVSGWTLPLLMGVRRVEVVRDFTAPTTIVNSPDEALRQFGGDPRAKNSADGPVLSLADSQTWTTLARGLAARKPFFVSTRHPTAGLVFERLPRSMNGEDGVIPLKRLPRIGVYAPWESSMDEGWLRWVLDHFQIPFITVRNEAIRAGKLNGLIDVLILPDVTASDLDHGRRPGSIPAKFSEGLDPEGSLAVREFVENGGTLVACDGSCQWAIDLLQLPLVNVTKEPAAKGFSCPGSVLRGVVEGNAWTAGLPSEIPLFFSSATAWREMTKQEREAANRRELPLSVHMRYAPDRLLLSGFIESPKAIEGQAAWVSARRGAGEVHLFGFRPHYRSWSQATFHLLFRTILLAPAANLSSTVSQAPVTSP